MGLQVEGRALDRKGAVHEYLNIIGPSGEGQTPLKPGESFLRSENKRERESCHERKGWRRPAKLVFQRRAFRVISQADP